MIGIGIGIPISSVLGSSAPAWTPADLPNLELWLSQEGLESVGHNNRLSQWDDASGNARHAVQATGTAQPLVLLNADGKWEASFDGGDYLTCGNVLNITGAMTIWAVLSMGTVKANEVFVSRDDGSNNGYSLLRNSTGNSYVFIAKVGGQVQSKSSLASAEINSMHGLVALVNPGSDVNYRKNGAAFGTSVFSVTGAINDPAGEHFMVGSRKISAPQLHLIGVVREIGVCSGIISGDDLTNLEAHMAGLV